MATTNKRLKKNISFSPSEKDIYDFLTEQPNASSLIKELVLRYMIEIGVYKDLKDRAMKVYAKDYSNFVVNMSTPKLNIKKRLQTMQIEKQNQFIIDILKPNVHYDVEERIKRELTIHSNLKIVFIDTFAKIRNSKDRDYESEYEEATFFHELAYKYHIAIILVTHVRKEIDINHPFDAIYGSRGLTAGSDSILVMFKKNHLSKNRKLAIQGKDIPDDEITLYMNDFQVLE